ncbi:unnamed protein product [Auanema sp. JU1783]|nr:unnamed protein product [Auanema sp. JU1783]
MKPRIKWFQLLLFPSIISLFSVQCLPCSYKAPRAENIILKVPLGNELNEDDEFGSSFRSRRSADDIFLPLRIRLHFDDSIRNLTEDKQLYVNSSLLPEAAGFWERALRVKRTSDAPIRLRRKCISSFYYYRKDKRALACDIGCRDITKCGEAVIPHDHLLDCSYCTSSDDCFNSGDVGTGIREADFVLYVTAIATQRCDMPDTLAYAAHCQQEAELDRPIAGHVNLCPQAISTHKHDREILVSTVKHELLHALGFSVGLFAFFRDEYGKPRTKRNSYGKPLTLNKEKGIYLWDSNTIDTILRLDWWTGKGKTVHPVRMMVTPKVREEARKHFGCPTLEGAELENQGGDGTALTHWEKRVFENEAMTGTHTQNPVYSRLTLALLEDSGWYKPNYEVAEELHWGRNLGCSFVQKSCGEWIHRKRKQGKLPFPYCDEIKHDGTKSLAVTRCTSQRDSLSLCNLIPYKQPLPRQFRHFSQLDGISAEGLQYYGGAVELADFCPYSQEFEWKMINSSIRRDSRCELDGNNRNGEDILEVYGSSSRCFDFVSPWTERKCGRLRTLTHYMAGCYEHVCENNRLYIGTHNSTLYPCYFDGQKVHIHRITEGWLREGVIICPPCQDFCNNCQAMPENDDYIGDPELDEPCSATLISVITSLTFAVLTCLILS